MQAITISSILGPLLQRLTHLQAPTATNAKNFFPWAEVVELCTLPWFDLQPFAINGI